MAESVYDIFKGKAQRARDAADERCAQVYAKDKRIYDIDRELADTGMKIFAAALADDDKREAAFARLEARLNALKAEKADRLEALGLPRNYTDVKYECEKCSDTGYVGIKMCDCLKRAVTQQNYQRSGIGKYLESQTFDNFDLSLYPMENRRDMENTLKAARGFARDFGSGESMLFLGGTGLGKTHLSSAIAKEVIKKGHTVAYDSAQNILSAFERDRFLREDERRVSDKYLEADLLIIDDLGSEITSKSSTSYFYTVINTRLIASKSTIVSTNLNVNELRTQYDDRIVSRLLGEYTVCLFKGDDVRKVKRIR